MDQSIRAAEDMMAASGKAIKLTVDLTTVVLRFVGHSAMGMAAMVADCPGAARCDKISGTCQSGRAALQYPRGYAGL